MGYKKYNVYNCNANDYINHQNLKEIFPGEGKILFANNDSYLSVVTDIRMDKRFSGNPFIDVVEFDLGSSFDISISLSACKQVRGRRKWISDSSEVEDWAISKSDNIGCKFLIRKIIQGSKVITRKGETLAFKVAKVSGRVEIVDNDVFSKVYVDGIGTGKAFGFGMIDVSGV